MLKQTSVEVSDDLIKLGHSIKESPIFNKLDSINGSAINLENFMSLETRLKNVEDQHLTKSRLELTLENYFQKFEEKLEIKFRKIDEKIDETKKTIEEKIDETKKAIDEKIENVKQDLKNEMAKMHKISEYNQMCRVKNSKIVHDNAEIDWPKGFTKEIRIPGRTFEDFKNLTKEDAIVTLKSYDMEDYFQVSKTAKTDKSALAQIVGIFPEIVN